MVLILVKFLKPPKEAKFISSQKKPTFMVRSSKVGQNKLEILIKDYSTFY